MICKFVFNLNHDRFQSNLFVVRTKPGCLASRLASCLVVCTTADVDLEGRVRTVFQSVDQTRRAIVEGDLFLSARSSFLSFPFLSFLFLSFPFFLSVTQIRALKSRFS